MAASPVQLVLANPGYPGAPGAVNIRAQLRAIARRPAWTFHRIEQSLSLLTMNFNALWVNALRLRDAGRCTHFLMLHADVNPRGDDWLDLLMAEMARVEADVLSAIIAIKDDRGLTSTAFDTHPWRPTRLTRLEAQSHHPVTWTAPDLLVNTGCLLVDFRRPWVEKICFTVRDQIRRDERGQWVAEVESEDWNFSRQCHALGVRLFATRAVPIDHHGVTSWPSDGAAGWVADHQNLALALAARQPS